MEQRHTLSGPRGFRGLARRSGRQALAWIGLVVVLSTIAYGLHVAAAAIAPTASAAPAGVPAEAGSRWVLLSSVDAQGAPLHVACLTTPDRLAADALTVRAEDLDAVATELCTTWSTDRALTSTGHDASGGPLLYVGLNSWIAADPRAAPSPEDGS
jgi:hypothetical protein